MNAIDRFLYKFAIMTFMLLTIISLDKFKIINIQSIKNELSQNINILKLIDNLNGKTKIIFVDLEDVASVNGNLYQTEDILNGKRIILDNYEAIECLSLGMVVRIDGKDVYILDNNNYLYCYKNINNIDVNIYQIVRKNQIIGRANLSKEGTNYYDVYVTKDNKVVKLNI